MCFLGYVCHTAASIIYAATTQMSIDFTCRRIKTPDTAANLPPGEAESLS